MIKGPLILALLLVLVGCASRPPVVISASTWRQVDGEIVAASLAASGPAEHYAREAMQRWRRLVQQRTEAEFIPWYTSYWTQQWLTLKVSWYQLSADPAKRLASYLQAQYHDRVLRPVARQVDPRQVMGQATGLYLRSLGERIQAIAPRYGVPLEQFDRRLKGIPLIVPAPPAGQGASLYQVLHARSLNKLPAYVALLERIHGRTGGVGGRALDARVAAVALRANQKLTGDLTSRGIAGAVAAGVGGVAGVVISLGVAGVSAVTHDNQRTVMTSQLRQELSAAVDEEWRSLLDNPSNGVMAGVYYLSGQLEAGLLDTATSSPMLMPLAHELPAESATLCGLFC